MDIKVNDNILRNIYESVLKLLEPSTIEEIYKTILDEAVTLVHAKNGSIFLAKDRSLRRVYSTVPIESQLKPRKRGNTYWVYKTGQPMIMEESEVKTLHPDAKKIKSIVIIPLAYDKNPLGVLTLQSEKENHFTPKQVDTLQLFGAMASLAITKAQSYTQMVEALETRKFFMSMASHELKTPLTSINAYSELLTKKLDKNSKTFTYAVSLSNEVTRLKRLVNEIFHTTDRINKKQLRYEFAECSIRQVIQECINSYKHTKGAKRIHFVDKLKKDDLVWGDFDKLLQVLNNLLSNALKFSPESEPVTIILNSNKTNVTLSVVDNGKGIPKEDKKKIFELFYRGKNNEFSGMGLGLYLVKKIVTKHKGTVHVASDNSHGTTFTVTIPLLIYGRNH